MSNPRKKRLLAVTAAAAVTALGLAACSGSSGGSNNAATTTTAAFDAANGKIFNPSDKKGGTITMADEGEPDSTDPGDSYYGYTWDLMRLYGRGLVMFDVAPGDGSSKLSGDLADGLGKPSDNAKTWTYKLKSGLKFEDGTAITSKDIKYAITRTLDKDIFPDAPTYFDDLLAWPADYKGAYKSKGVDVKSAIDTPDDSTIIFHLKNSFSGFDYLMTTSQAYPVPEAKDTGAKYKEHPMSSGPYMFDTYEAGKKFTLKRNPNWDAKTDPQRKALPDGYEYSMNVNQDDIDNRIIAGDLDIHVTGTGVTPATQGKVLSDPNLKARADNPTLARLWYTSIPTTVAPLDNKDCRMAIMYAMDRTAYQTAYGGAFAGGAIATSLMPPLIPGSLKKDFYPSQDNKGDLTKAKEALTKCGKPDGFEITMAFRNERPKEKALAEAFQQQLAKVGIKVTPKGFAKKDYFSTYAGNPPYVKANNIGLAANGWGADWNDGYGFLAQIVDSRVIRETGGSSNISVRMPEVDKLIDQAAVETDNAKREALYGQIDTLVMDNAVIYPGVWAKALLVRGKTLTNVFVNQAYGMYDYTSLGKQ